MKSLVLVAKSVRVPKADKRWLTYDEMKAEFTKKITPHSLANAVMVLCGYSPVSNYLGIEAIWPSSNTIYHGVKNSNFEFEEDKLFIETCTTFKSEGKDTGKAKTGFFDSRWFENSYYNQRGTPDPMLMTDFETWLTARYPENISFHHRMLAFEKEVVSVGATKNDETLSAWIDANLPKKFHLFSYLKKASYWASLSKYNTSTFFVRGNGEITEFKEKGSVVLVGGPRLMIHGTGKIKIQLDDDLYYTVNEEMATGPMFATIGDSGMLWIEETHE